MFEFGHERFIFEDFKYCYLVSQNRFVFCLFIVAGFVLFCFFVVGGFVCVCVWRVWCVF